MQGAGSRFQGCEASTNRTPIIAGTVESALVALANGVDALDLLARALHLACPEQVEDADAGIPRQVGGLLWQGWQGRLLG